MNECPRAFTNGGINGFTLLDYRPADLRNRFTQAYPIGLEERLYEFSTGLGKPEIVGR